MSCGQTRLHRDRSSCRIAEVLVYFLFPTPRDCERVATFAGLMSPRCSVALMVLRLADRGRISSLSFNRRRTGLAPSESVSSWYPFWMCESRSCSVSVSFGRRPAGFFFAIFYVHRRRVSSPPRPVGALGTRLGNRRHIAARAETKGCGLMPHHAFDSPQRCRLR
jgi:hypothetical protein